MTDDVQWITNRFPPQSKLHQQPMSLKHHKLSQLYLTSCFYRDDMKTTTMLGGPSIVRHIPFGSPGFCSNGTWSPQNGHELLPKRYAIPFSPAPTCEASLSSHLMGLGRKSRPADGDQTCFLLKMVISSQRAGENWFSKKLKATWNKAHKLGCCYHWLARL